jgi:hypothetical protein
MNAASTHQKQPAPKVMVSLAFAVLEEISELTMVIFCELEF